MRDVEATVHAGFPGVWRWRTAFAAPERYAWAVETNVGFNHYLFDGTTGRIFVGERLVATEAAAATALRSHARFTAVAHLDVLRLPAVTVTPLAPSDVPAGAAAGLAVVYPDTGDRYTLGLDADARVVVAEGPVALPPYGGGRLVAAFDDFRPVRGFVLPHRTTYTFRAAPLADERALAVCPAAALADEVFRTPGRIPPCAPPGSAGP